MKNKFTFTAAIFLFLSFVMGAALPAFAATTTDPAKNSAHISKLQTVAIKEIDRRTLSLNELSQKIEAMKHVSDADKSSLMSTISAQLSELATLKAKIAADQDIVTLRSDVQSITKSYRIYLLVIPRGHITANADREIFVAGELTSVAEKLKTRIATLGATGKDVTSLNTTLADMNTKITDAITQANITVSTVSALTPDEGDKTKHDANTQALKDARAKVKLAETDLKAARQDIKTITVSLKTQKETTTASSSNK